MNVIERWQRPILIISASLVAGFTLWVSPGSFPPVKQWSALLLTVLLRSLAAMFVMQLVLHVDEPKYKKSWRLLAVALALFTISDGYVAVSFAYQGVMPSTPSGADLVRMAGLLAAVAMVISYPLVPPEPFGRIREFLDIGILILAGSTLAFLILVWPVFEIGLGEMEAVFWLSIAPLADLSILLLVVRVVLRMDDRSGRWTFRMLGLAFFAYLISDLGASYSTIFIEPLNAGLNYAGVMAGSVLIMLAVLRWRSGPGGRFRFTELERWRSKVALRFEPLLPIAVTYVVVGYILFDWWYDKQVNWGAVFMAAILSVMLIVRQGVVVGQFEMRQFAALVQFSADAAFVCQKDGRLNLANPALFSLLQTTDMNVDNLNLNTMLRDEESVNSILASGGKEGWVGEVFIQAVDRSVLVSLSLMPIRNRSGQSQLLAGTAHDLTLVHEREDALREALGELADAHANLELLNRELEEKVTERTGALQETVAELQKLNIELQSLDQMKSEFVALVSHELRAPLTNIRSGIELIIETSPELDHSIDERLRVVEEETVRLTGFVEAILDLSALDAGRFPLQVLPVPLEEIFQRVIQRMPELMDKRRVSLNMAEDLPDVLADERALESVLFHILDNAVKYAPESRIEVEAWQEEDQVICSVVDHGEGIPLELREKAFDMFQRLDASDTREVYGHGLGLHMARRFLDAMEGGIRAEEPVDGGTRIVVWIPTSTTLQ